MAAGASHAIDATVGTASEGRGSRPLPAASGSKGVAAMALAPGPNTSDAVLLVDHPAVGANTFAPPRVVHSSLQCAVRLGRRQTFSSPPPPGGWPTPSRQSPGGDVADRGLPSACAPVILHEPTSTTSPPATSPPPASPFPAATAGGPYADLVGCCRPLHRRGDGTPPFLRPAPSVGTAAAPMGDDRFFTPAADALDSAHNSVADSFPARHRPASSSPTRRRPTPPPSALPPGEILPNARLVAGIRERKGGGTKEEGLEREGMIRGPSQCIFVCK